MKITPNTTVGEIARTVTLRAQLLDRLGIDYCCGGKKSLAEACQAKGLDPATVATLLSAIDEDTPVPAGPNPDALGLTALCDHIEQVHHRYLRQELPRLDQLAQKVAAVHGEQDRRLLEVQRLFGRFRAAMSSHTDEEEKSIFPAIRRLDARGTWPEGLHLKADLEKLESEHDRAGAALEQLHGLTDGYVPPEWACHTFRDLYDGLARLEQDTHQHVHKENNILFPRALAAAE